MGLHNRYPSYFYKRGNLFNTYLGYSDDRGLPTEKEAPKKATRPRRSPTKRKTPLSKEQSRVQQKSRPARASAEAGARLAGFANAYMTLAETERLLRLIADHAGEPSASEAELDWRLPIRLGEFVMEHVAPDVAAAYLAALQGRLERGEPFIQKTAAPSGES
jgi:hypothetical protein